VPALDDIVAGALEAGAHGARMVGGGFGGSAIALVDADVVDAVTAAITHRSVRARREPPRTFVTVPSPGARRLV
jgi:galactokinase